MAMLDASGEGVDSGVAEAEGVGVGVGVASVFPAGVPEHPEAARISAHAIIIVAKRLRTILFMFFPHFQSSFRKKLRQFIHR